MFSNPPSYEAAIAIPAGSMRLPAYKFAHLGRYHPYARYTHYLWRFFRDEINSTDEHGNGEGELEPPLYVDDLQPMLPPQGNHQPVLFPQDLSVADLALALERLRIRSGEPTVVQSITPDEPTSSEGTSSSC